MEKPNILESVTPCSGQYSAKADLRLNAWLAFAAALYCVELAFARRNPGWSPLVRGLAALVPLLPALLYVRAWLRFVRGMDELQRRVQSEAFLFATLGTAIVGIVVATLADNGVSVGGARHGLGLGGAFMVMFALWLVGGALANRRYR